MAKKNKTKSNPKKGQSKNPGKSNEQMNMERNQEVQRCLNEEEQFEVPEHLPIEKIKALNSIVEMKLQYQLSEKMLALEEFRNCHELASKIGLTQNKVRSNKDCVLPKAVSPYFQSVLANIEKLNDFLRRLEDHVASQEANKSHYGRELSSV
jgi:hypothetical protein